MSIAARELDLKGEATSPVKRRLFSTRSSYVLAFCTAVILYIVAQRTAMKDVILYLGVKDTDDAMRLLNVRALLAGQAWYDMTQYRILPPEGISLHWSRYLDAPLAGLLLGLTTVMSPALAERTLAVLWPFGLFVIYLVLIGATARRLFGLPAACYAILAAGLASSINWFGAGRVDHHNVQILAMLAIVSSLAIDGRPYILGGIAGTVAALSLAVGLEAVPLIIGIGLALTLKYIVGVPKAREQLAAFGLSLGIVTPILFVGQTSPSLWLVPTCDSLSVPWLALSTAAAVTCMLLSAVGRVLRTWLHRAVLVSLTSLVVCLLLYPSLQDCIAGPYASLPESQKEVIGNITEALPFYHVLATAPSVALAIIAPLAVAALIITMRLSRRDLRAGGPNDSWALTKLSVALWLGIMLAQVQIRASIIGWAVFPVAAGYIVSVLVQRSGIHLSFSEVAKKLGLGTLLLSQTWILIGLLVSSSSKVGAIDAGCLHPSQISALNALPPARVLAPLDFGPHILLHTHHVVFSAPYHRSAPAVINGVAPFARDETVMLDVVRQYRPDYIIVCHDLNYGAEDSVGTRLARGESRFWTERVEIAQTSLVVWRVIPERVGRFFKAASPVE
ncbi:hypothetical protein [Microvirga arabica]|uniref:hypothetical protein n=1 Tax=Microvirga arabica TaxID=1128671 RepID=UPI00193988DB|nr:hypothetical protein [Microvirga arabica]MBM1172020.1 hypothetical protein [Microvirga arabica]